MNRRSVPAVVLGVVLLAAFVVLGVLVGGRPAALDLAIADALRGLWRETLGDVVSVVSDVFGPVVPVVFGVVLLVAAWLSWRREDRRRAAVLLRVAMLLGLCRVTSFVGKPLFVRDRPREYPEFAYPSGHVVSMASAGFAAVVLCRWLAPRLLRPVLAAAVLATFVSAACRVLLGVHWFTDTVGAVLAVTGVGLLGCAALRLLPSQAGRLSATRDAA